MCHKLSLTAARQQHCGCCRTTIIQYKPEGVCVCEGGGPSTDDHITGCLFSLLVTDCKRAFCAAKQRLQGLSAVFLQQGEQQKRHTCDMQLHMAMSPWGGCLLTSTGVIPPAVAEWKASVSPPSRL